MIIRQIIRSIDLHSRYLERNYGLTGPQLLLISEIAKYPHITQKELAITTCISSSTVNNIIDRLEERHLVVRHRSERDKRKSELTITPVAKRILGSGPQLLHSEFLEKFDQIPSEQQTRLLESLQSIASMMLSAAVPEHPFLRNSGEEWIQQMYDNQISVKDYEQPKDSD